MGVSVNLDLGDVFRRTWKIGWNYKVLWLAQLLPGLFTLLIFPLFLLINPAFVPFLPSQWSQLASGPRPVAGEIAFAAILAVVYLCLAVLVQSATMLGVLEVERGAKRLSLRRLIPRAWLYFWTVLGLYLVFLGAWLLVMSVFGSILFALGTSSLRLVIVCMTPFLAALVPIAFLAHSVMQLAQASVLAEDMGVREAISRAWQLFRTNIPSLVVFMAILYFGFYALNMLVMIPAMFPITLTAFVRDLGGASSPSLPLLLRGILPLGMAFMLCVQGIVMVFFQTAWTVIFTRLTRKMEGLAVAPVVVA
jgi:hypothetical protein